jgi:hypothetical protein
VELHHVDGHGPDPDRAVTSPFDDALDMAVIVFLSELAPMCPASAPRRTGKQPELVRSVGEEKRWSDVVRSLATQVGEAAESNS